MCIRDRHKVDELGGFRAKLMVHGAGGIHTGFVAGNGLGIAVLEHDGQIGEGGAGNAGALSLYADGKWQGSALCPEKVSADADMEKLLERCWQKQEPKEKLLAQGGRVELLYWDPAENKSFMIPAKN